MMDKKIMHLLLRSIIIFPLDDRLMATGVPPTHSNVLSSLLGRMMDLSNVLFSDQYHPRMIIFNEWIIENHGHSRKAFSNGY